MTFLLHSKLIDKNNPNHMFDVANLAKSCEAILKELRPPNSHLNLLDILILL